MSPVDVSVVIPAWNEAEYLDETIGRISAALRANDVGGLTWEIIVCDNASTDGTAEIARRAGAQVVFEPERGIARARNAGAHVAQGKWVLFIDADSYPSPELIAEVRMLLDDESIVGCGSTVKGVGGVWWQTLRMQRDNLVLRALGMSAGVFLLCRYEALRVLEGFSPDLYALEELDFVVRLKWYGLLRGQKFRTLHRHPVVTSGRGKVSFLVMAASFVIAGLLLLQHTLLPKSLRIRGGRKLLAFWYPPRR